MLAALAADGLPIGAAPGVRAWCPLCKERVTPKCGEIVSHHFAHQCREDCDPWSEGETEWHRRWKMLVPVEQREVVIGNHRADMVTETAIWELQHSSISPAEIRAREQHYGPRLVWVFDCTEAYREGRLDLRCPDAGKNYRTFRWYHARKSIAACRRRVYLDLGDGLLLRLGRMYPHAPTGGWGYLQQFDLECEMARP